MVSPVRVRVPPLLKYLQNMRKIERLEPSDPVVGTRVAGDPEMFLKDTEKLVLEEAEQLHECCESLLTKQKRLTGPLAENHNSRFDQTYLPHLRIGHGITLVATSPEGPSL